MPTVISQSWNGSYVGTRNELIADVCAYKGFSTEDPDLTIRVLKFLDKSIMDLNTYPWESSRVAESGIVLTEGQQWVLLSAQCFKESQAYLVHNTDGDQPPMKSLPWIHFKRMYSSSNKSGRPSIYSIFNFEKDGRLYFDTLPDTSTVADYTFAVEYYKRLPLISSVSLNESPDIPQEFENTILYGAYKRICAHLGDQSGMQANAALEREALERLQRIDIMHPDADRRFRLVDEVLANQPIPSGYIFPF